MIIVLQNLRYLSISLWSVLVFTILKLPTRFWTSFDIAPLPNTNIASSSVTLSDIHSPHGFAVGDVATTPTFLFLHSSKFTVSTPCDLQTTHSKFLYLSSVTLPTLLNFTDNTFISSEFLISGLSYAPSTLADGNRSNTTGVMSDLSFNITFWYIPIYK